MKKNIFTVVSLILALSACSDEKSSSLQLISLEELATLEQQHIAKQELLKKELTLEQLASGSERSKSNTNQPGQITLHAPKQTTRYASADSLNGPEIKILQPLLTSTVTNPMSVHVEFASRSPDIGINMDSLKLTYKKYWGIDLTDKIVDYIEGQSINAPDVELPEGKHILEIYIEDNERNGSTKLIEVEIAES